MLKLKLNLWNRLLGVLVFQLICFCFCFLGSGCVILPYVWGEVRGTFCSWRWKMLFFGLSLCIIIILVFHYFSIFVVTCYSFSLDYLIILLLFLLPLFDHSLSWGCSRKQPYLLKVGVEVRFVYTLSSPRLACRITLNYLLFLLLFSLLFRLGYVLTVRLGFNMLECLSNKEEIFMKHAMVVLSCIRVSRLLQI